ncbi:intradiol ring-cleavage dioxygenase [Streptomyces sp. NPDC012888]|uniref:dioxygenase family protein n=1 Tax=Streptomyces sp. NPDC012888 TaxID=3364855 RepID=UPI0036BC8D43
MTDHGTPAPTRRTVLTAAGSAAVAALAAALATACGSPAASRAGAPKPPGAAAEPGCVLVTTAGSGPYYSGPGKRRSDITEGQAGVPLRLELTVVGVKSGCRPLTGATVDVWQADAQGVYSQNGATHLRGSQVTDASGRCVFETIVPGWYAGLAPHVHFKVRPASGGETTSVFYLPEDMLRQVYARQPYARRKAPADPNGRDGRYRSSGAAMTLAPVAHGAGYRAAYTVGIA